VDTVENVSHEERQLSGLGMPLDPPLLALQRARMPHHLLSLKPDDSRPTAAQIGSMLRDLPFKTIGDIARHAGDAEDPTGRTATGRRRRNTRHWVTVHDIAQRLGLDDDASDAAVRHAIEQGWFVADSEPPHGVRLSVVPTAT
jgi:hypothetical protein